MLQLTKRCSYWLDERKTSFSAVFICCLNTVQKYIYYITILLLVLVANFLTKTLLPKFRDDYKHRQFGRLGSHEEICGLTNYFVTRKSKNFQPFLVDPTNNTGLIYFMNRYG